MERRSKIHSERVSTRGENRVFTVEIPHNAKKVVGILVSTKLTGDPIAVNRHYIGNSIPAVFNNAFIQALGNEQMESTVKVFNVNAAAGEKVYYARPVRIDGFPSFKINNVSSGFGNPDIVSVTDAETGYTEDYYLFESNASGLGSVQLYVY